jgi:hypothetical protein
MDFPPFVMVYHKQTKCPIHAEPKQNYIEHVLDYTSTALRQLLNDVHFTNQLKAVGMNEFPLHVTDILKR